MGKRRIRCLQRLGYYGSITGFDTRTDRVEDAQKIYNVDIIKNIEKINFGKYDCIIISVPPDQHNEYIKLAIEYKLPAFVEASVVIDGLSELCKIAEEKKVYIAPSCTMLFHPAIIDIKNIIEERKYGEVTNFNYHSGQYLPDWHPWESISDYYVSKRETGGAREIVPFELTWLIDILGMPQRIFGQYSKNLDLGVDIEDTYNIILKYETFSGNILVDVVSRFATRYLIINMEKGQIVWDWNYPELKLFDAIKKRWIIYRYPDATGEPEYNKNIIEDMYISEIKSFISAVQGNNEYPNTLEKDIAVLKLLNIFEVNANDQ